MDLKDTSIPGVQIVDSNIFQDARGAFSRFFCAQEMRAMLESRAITQINHSMTRNIGTIRGLHYQRPPHAEMKIIRCLKGRVFDVAVDLRQDSSTFLKWTAIELTPESHRAFVIPEGCAHGFQVLEADSELLYLHTAFYTPEAEGGVRFDDPRIHIDWPLNPTDISPRDLSHALLAENFKGIAV